MNTKNDSPQRPDIYILMNKLREYKAKFEQNDSMLALTFQQALDEIKRFRFEIAQLKQETVNKDTARLSYLLAGKRLIVTDGMMRYDAGLSYHNVITREVIDNHIAASQSAEASTRGSSKLTAAEQEALYLENCLIARKLGLSAEQTEGINKAWRDAINPANPSSWSDPSNIEKPQRGKGT